MQAKVVTSVHPQQNAPASTPTPTQNTVRTQRSVEATHSTIFEAFDLKSEFVYNFFIEDETTVVSPRVGPIDEVPRYIYLSWRPVPIVRRDVELPTVGNRNDTKPDPKVFDRSGFTFNAVAAVDMDTAQSSLANGYVSPGQVRARLEAPNRKKKTTKFDQELHLFNGSAGDAGEARASMSTAPGLVPETSTRTTVPTNKTTRVTFVDGGIAGAFSDDRVNTAQRPEHVAAIVSLSQVASSAEVISEFGQIDPKRIPPPEFPAPPDLRGLTYAGYVIEKYLVAADGSMVLVATISVDDLSQRDFYDRDVLYGQSYAYRIRAIVRWTRKSGTGFFGQAEQAGIGYVCSFYGGDWSLWQQVSATDSTKPKPPDELTVRPVSRNNEIHVCWKVPDDPHRDIIRLDLYRKLILSGEDFTEWELLASFPMSNGLYIDKDLGPVEENTDSRFVYAMTSTTAHGNASALSEQLAASTTPLYKQLGEEPVKMISQAGASLNSTGAFSRLPLKPDHGPLVALRSLLFSLRSGKSSFPVFINDYIIRVTSLMTGEVTDVQLRATTTDVVAGQSSGRP